MDNFDLRKYLAEGRLFENTINQISSRISKLGKEAGISSDDIEEYVDGLESSFEPDAYKNVTDKELLKDLKLAVKNLDEGFKVGQKVTYLGHPAEITLVDKDVMDRVYYNVSYDKGNGKTKVSNIYNKDGEIKENMSMNEDKIDREKIEGILWNLKNSNKLSNPSDPKKKEALIKKLEKQLSRLKENMYIDDEEFEMEMGRSKKDSLKKEMMMHVDQLMDGNIDMIDFMNVVEEIMLDVKIAAKDEELNKRKNNG